MLKTKFHKNQKKTIPKYRLIGGTIFYIYPARGAARIPAPPISYATDWPSWPYLRFPAECRRRTGRLL